MAEKIAILGGGISGLALAYRLQGDATVFEKSDRVGGWIRTEKTDGFLFECGPRSLRPHLKTLQLIEELGLQEEIIVPPAQAKKRYLYTNQKLKRIRPFSLLKGMWRDVWTSPGTGEETIHAFVSRRFGKKIAEEYFDPLTLGIYAGDSTKLSMKCCFPKLYEWEQQYGSVVKGFFCSKKPKGTSPFVNQMLSYPLYSFRNGMETLPQALASRVHVKLNSEIAEIKENTLIFSSGKTETFDKIYSTLPASFYTDSIPFVSLAVVHLGYRKKVLPKEGFGYLVPTKEREKVFGVVWDSSVFPQQNGSPSETRLTVMVKELEGCEAIALEAVSRHLGISICPDVIKTTLAKRAIPQYHVGHERKVAHLRQKHPHLTLLGSSFSGVSVNDQID